MPLSRPETRGVACESTVSTWLFCCLYGEIRLYLPILGLKALQRECWLSFAMKTTNSRLVLLPLCEVFSIACVQTGTRLVSVVRSRGGVRYSRVANVLKHGKTFGTLESARYIRSWGVSVKRGSTVHTMLVNWIGNGRHQAPTMQSTYQYTVHVQSCKAYPECCVFANVLAYTQNHSNWGT